MSYPGVEEIDLTIALDGLQQGAAGILKRIRPQWRDEDIVYKVFTEGLSNTMIGCHHKEDPQYTDCVLVRRYGDGSDVFSNREVEMALLYIFSQAGCCRPLYARFNNGIVYGFQPGVCPSLESVREPHISKLIAAELALYHSIDMDKYIAGVDTEGVRYLKHRQPAMFKLTRRMLSQSTETFADSSITERYRQFLPPLSELHTELDHLEGHLTSLGSPIVLCHGDVIPNNIVYNQTEERCYLIDFEICDFNHQAMDIASHFNEWAGLDSPDYSLYPDKQTQLAWIKTYLDVYKALQGHSNTNPTEAEILKLYVQVNKFSLLPHLENVAWALYQTSVAVQTADFDYLGFAIARYDRYKSTKDELLSMELPQEQ